MNKFTRYTFTVLLALILNACSMPAKISPSTAPVQSPAPGEGMVKPGDKIGDMTVEQGAPTLPYPYLWRFCDYMDDDYEPVKSTSDCSVPGMTGLTVSLGWLARETKFDSNWDAMEWELMIDGYQMDLEAFEIYESAYTVHGEDNKSREWLLNLKNITPGQHILQLRQSIHTAVDDGMHFYQPGVYEHEVHFTVLEKAEYPVLSEDINTGQHAYNSEKAGLDFLLYLPGDYDNDPQQEWPLIVYLHGAPLRGAPLELLMEEPLPKKLGNEMDFPFIVISPLGDGEYEFWGKEDLIDSLFTLLGEIQTQFSVDVNRIYLTGNDMGGNGVWAIGLRQPEYFAALVPVGGYLGYPFEVPENICVLKDAPVWAFHGKRDPFVPVEAEQDLVEALVACGGDAHLTVSQDMKNDIPYKVYADPELYEWFLSHSRNIQ